MNFFVRNIFHLQGFELRVEWDGSISEHIDNK